MELIDSNTVVSTIVGGSTGYLSEFLPIFAFVVGLALAFAVISGIISSFFGKNLHDEDEGV